MEYIKKNIHWIISINVAIFVIAYAYGCEPKTQSLIYPERKVTRPELTTELELLESRASSGYNDLDRKERIRNIVLNQSLVIAQSGSVNPVGVITSILAILGLGVGADDVRLRKKIKETLQYGPPEPNEKK